MFATIPALTLLAVLVPGAPPLKALLVTGGCCHDYEFQSRALKEAPLAAGKIDWTVINEGGTGTSGKTRLYDDPSWAKGYDIVVHNECFADTDDEEYIRRITEGHRVGVPAVVIHCAMHTYRAAKIDDWREMLGVSSFRHEHQSKYPVRVLERDHPILAGFPAQWTSPMDELYVIEKLWPNAWSLATARSEKTGLEHPVFWVNTFGKARVFGTTFGHSKETFSDPVFVNTVLRGLLWAAGRLDAPADDWAHGVKLPAGEKPINLFDGRTLSGWEGKTDLYWSVKDGTIRGANSGRVPASTYLYTRDSYRDFRLLLEVRQTRGPNFSTMHSAVAVLGEKLLDQGDPFSFRGPLVMFCNDWGVWDANRRNRIYPQGHPGPWLPEGIERVGEWNQLEILVRGERLRCVANGKLVFELTDRPDQLQKSPIGLQLHSNDRPQEFHFRGLVLVESPTDELVTLSR